MNNQHVQDGRHNGKNCKFNIPFQTIKGCLINFILICLFNTFKTT